MSKTENRSIKLNQHDITSQMTLKAKILILVLLILAFKLGYEAKSAKIFPISEWTFGSSAPFNNPTGLYDDFGRLISFPGKQEAVCPAQNQDTAVLLAIGQSNSANSAEKKFTTKYPHKVLNYFDGKCYVASSPLLGATGAKGEFMTPLADKLIESGKYKSVLIISSGIENSPISRWQRDGDLNGMLLDVIDKVGSKYKITEIIWHQGESDYINNTSAKVYARSFNSLVETLKEKDVDSPIFISIATRCRGGWKENNPTSVGQRQLVDHKKIFLGADTDNILNDPDRSPDRCHFSEAGQLKTAESFSTAIQRVRQ